MTGVLRNKLGITDQEQLDRVEATFVAVRSYELAAEPIRGKFDLAHLQEIHRWLFSDVYDWAGQIRTVDISKGETRFASHTHIEGYAPQITRPLAQEKYLRGLGPDEFSERVGHYLGELNVLHPFREGNGRATREFFSQLAGAAGYEIDWRGMTRDDMIAASIAAYGGDSRPLARLVRDNLRDHEHDRLHDLARAATGRDVRLVRAAPGQTYEGVIIGTTERYVVQAQLKPDGIMVLHNRRALALGGTGQLEIGKAVEIRYPHGGAGLVQEVPSHDNSLTHANEQYRSRERER